MVQKSNGNHIKESIKCSNYNMNIRRKWEPNFMSKSTRSMLYDLYLGNDHAVSCQKALKKVGLVSSWLKITNLGLLALTDWPSMGKFCVCVCVCVILPKPKGWSLRNIYIQGEKKSQQRIVKKIYPNDWRTSKAITSCTFLNFDPLHKFPSDATTEYHKLGGLNNRNLFSQFRRPEVWI